MRPAAVSVAVARLAVGRAGWVIGDQALSSLTNFVLTLLVARAVSTEDFGAFALATTTYWLALGLARALTTEAFVVTYPDAEEAIAGRGVARVTGAAVGVGIAAGAACLVAGLVLQGTLAKALLIMGPLLPGLLLQDAWRFAFFARRRGGAALANDLAWAIALVPTMLFALTLGGGSVTWLILAWGVSGNAAGLLGIVQARIRPQVRGTIAWWREQRELAPRFFGEFLVRSVSSQLTTYGLAAFVGLRGVGGLRAADLLLGPLNILFLANGLAGVAEGVRLLARGERTFRIAYVGLSAVLAACVLAWAGVLLLLPSAAGVQILGRSWTTARPLLIPVVLNTAAAAAGMGATTGLRALAAARRSLRTRLSLAVVLLTATLASAAVGGVYAAAWTMAASSAVASAVWWRQFFAELGERRARERAPSIRERPDPTVGVRAPAADAGRPQGAAR